MSKPNYKQIYTDMITIKHADKLKDCSAVLNKSELSIFDVINLQKKLFGPENNAIGHSNQLLKSYDKPTILKILEYQKKHEMNNAALSRHFMLSRNTVAKWKKLFLNDVTTNANHQF